MERIEEKLGIPSEFGISIYQTNYYGRDNGRDNWYSILYPCFEFEQIERYIIENDKAEKHKFCVAIGVMDASSFWPIDAFHSFIEDVKKLKIDYDLVFSGPKPPFTVYILDELIDKGYTYKEIICFLDKRIIPLRFNPTSFCGYDASFLPMTNGFNIHPIYKKMFEYLEPPKKIKDANAIYYLNQAIEQLGVEKCHDIINEYKTVTH